MSEVHIPKDIGFPKDVSFSLVVDDAIKHPYDEMYALFARTSLDKKDYSNEAISNSLEYIESVKGKNHFSKYKSVYEGTIFKQGTALKDLSEPLVVSDDIKNIVHIAENNVSKSAELLFHLNEAYFIDEKVQDIDFSAYVDISPEYSPGMATVEYLLSAPGFYRDLISSVGSLLMVKNEHPSINSLNIATLLLSYGESVSDIKDFFARNYGIDNQVTALKSYSVSTNNFLSIYDKSDFDSLKVWQKSMYRSYEKRISCTIPETPFVSIFLLDFFLKCNENNVDCISYFDKSNEVEKPKYYNMVENGALPFDTKNLNVVKNNYVNDNCFEYRHIENTVCAKFVTQSEYESSWREISQYFNLEKDFYFGDEVVVSLIRGIVVLYAIYRKNNPESYTFSILEGLFS